MWINKIFNEDCINTMKKIPHGVVDCIITSPPYNMTKRKGGYADKCKRYDEYSDWKREDEYINWMLLIFKGFNSVLKKDGSILFNFSYSIENPVLPSLLIAEIHRRTDFTLADTITWKKKTAIPHSASKNRLRRICESIYVFCRKSELDTFETNKNFNIGKNGQKYYEIIDNFIEAKNNDGPCAIHKATFSTDLINKLIKAYVKPNSIIYDPFIGIGTTGKSAIKNKCLYIGSEISKRYCEIALNSIKEEGSK